MIPTDLILPQSFRDLPDGGLAEYLAAIHEIVAQTGYVHARVEAFLHSVAGAHFVREVLQVCRSRLQHFAIALVATTSAWVLDRAFHHDDPVVVQS